MNKSNLEKIEIIGLFNKYDLSLNFRNIVKIIIAENGSGKTTVLNIIVSALTGNIVKLRNLPFIEISLYFKGKKSIKIIKNELYSRFDPKSYEKLKYHIISNFEDYIPSKLLNDMLSKNQPMEILINRLSKYLPPSKRRKLASFANNFKYTNNLFSFEDIEDTLNRIQNYLNGELLYLPTFRRIEEDLNKLGLKTQSREEVYNKRINFGMNDVEHLLKILTEEIRSEAMFEYSKMSGEILTDLLNDNIKIDREEKLQFNQHSLEVILSRIGEDKRLKDRNIINEIDRALSSRKQISEFLFYYLSKLMKIYNKQKTKDDKIKDFVNICNTYLVNKKMEYNEALAKVTIIDFQNEPIDFSNLSSGEKQIVSIFSKLYLENKKKLIIIIDEPELSLSLIWQRKLLPDIIKSQKCKLLLVTTHSPFIFDNEYDKYAEELVKNFRETNYDNDAPIISNNDDFFFDFEEE